MVFYLCDLSFAQLDVFYKQLQVWYVPLVLDSYYITTYKYDGNYAELSLV